MGFSKQSLVVKNIFTLLIFTLNEEKNKDKNKDFHWKIMNLFFLQEVNIANSHRKRSKAKQIKDHSKNYF